MLSNFCVVSLSFVISVPPHRHGTPRRSALVQGDTGEIRAVDVIPNDPCFIMYSRKGYIKRMPADAFALQNRGTRGAPCWPVGGSFPVCLLSLCVCFPVWLLPCVFAFVVWLLPCQRHTLRTHRPARGPDA